MFNIMSDIIHNISNTLIYMISDRHTNGFIEISIEAGLLLGGNDI